MFELNKDEFVGKSIGGKVISDVSFIASLQLINVIFENGEYERYTLQNYFNSEIHFDVNEPMFDITPADIESVDDSEASDVEPVYDVETADLEPADDIETTDIEPADDEVTEDIE